MRAADQPKESRSRMGTSERKAALLDGYQRLRANRRTANYGTGRSARASFGVESRNTPLRPFPAPLSVSPYLPLTELLNVACTRQRMRNPARLKRKQVVSPEKIHLSHIGCCRIALPLSYQTFFLPTNQSNVSESYRSESEYRGHDRPSKRDRTLRTCRPFGQRLLESAWSHYDISGQIMTSYLYLSFIISTSACRISTWSSGAHENGPRAVSELS